MHAGAARGRGLRIYGARGQRGSASPRPGGGRVPAPFRLWAGPGRAGRDGSGRPQQGWGWGRRGSRARHPRGPARRCLWPQPGHAEEEAWRTGWRTRPCTGLGCGGSLGAWGKARPSASPGSRPAVGPFGLFPRGVQGCSVHRGRIRAPTHSRLLRAASPGGEPAGGAPVQSAQWSAAAQGGPREAGRPPPRPQGLRVRWQATLPPVSPAGHLGLCRPLVPGARTAGQTGVGGGCCPGCSPRPQPRPEGAVSSSDCHLVQEPSEQEQPWLLGL